MLLPREGILIRILAEALTEGLVRVDGVHRLELHAQAVVLGERRDGPREAPAARVVLVLAVTIEHVLQHGWAWRDRACAPPRAPKVAVSLGFLDQGHVTHRGGLLLPAAVHVKTRGFSAKGWVRTPETNHSVGKHVRARSRRRVSILQFQRPIISGPEERGARGPRRGREDPFG